MPISLFIYVNWILHIHCTHTPSSRRTFVSFFCLMRIIDKFASTGPSTSFKGNSLEPFQTALKRHFKFIAPNLTLIPTCVQTTELILGRWHIANRLIIFFSLSCSRFKSIRNSREPYFTKRTKATTSDSSFAAFNISFRRKFARFQFC